MKILVAPDSYKGCLKALDVAGFMTKGIKRVSSAIEVVSIPFADGGEGTVEAMVTGAGGRIISTRTKGPLTDEIESFFGILDDGHTAVIEMAAASGLSLVPLDSRNPLKTTTYGTGQLIKKAMDSGCTDIIIGVGGSATNDGGTGMAQALGAVFFDNEGNTLPVGGKILSLIADYDLSGIDSRISEIKITVACDVTNSFCGYNGAAYVYAAQKGASGDQIKLLDTGLSNLASVIKVKTGVDINTIEGAGAAGGLAGGLVAFTGAELEKGVQIISDVCNLDGHMQDVDLAITGEGSTDFQTVNGKVPAGIAKSAGKYKIPVVCISGYLGDGYEKVYDIGIDAVFSISPGPLTLDESIKNAGRFIEETTRNAVSLFIKGKF